MVEVNEGEAPAERERDIAERERDIAERERDIAERDTVEEAALDAAAEEVAELELDADHRQIRLHHFPSSLCSQQVRLALAEKGVAWEDVTVNTGPAHEHFEPEYAKLNPKLVVPTLEVDGTVVTEVVDIVNFVDRSFGGPELMPSDPEAREEALRWIERQDSFPISELTYGRSKGLTRWFQRWTLKQRRKRLRKLMKKHPELREIYLAKLEHLEVLRGTIGDRALMDQLVVEVEDMLDEIEEALEEREWLAGDEYSLADLLWTAVLARLDHIGFSRSLSERRHPRVADWYQRLRERPSWGEGIRRLSPLEVARIYGPAVLKTFLIAWVIKWAVLTPLIYGLTALLNCSGS
nr:glutathione S-transferase family protein [Pseudenhygromyxa sp. WMMC2535]